MRLLYLSADPGIPILGGKGASVHVRALLAELAALGHDVIAASPRLEPGINDLPLGVRGVEIPAVRPRECATPAEVLAQAVLQTAAVEALARDAGIEAIYERYSLASFAGARASVTLGIPMVLEVNAPLRAEEERFRQLAHEGAAIQAELETFAAARRIFVISGSLAQWLTDNGVNATRVEVMENAPPARSFATKAPIDKSADVVVGFSGGLKPWHGIENLLQGFELALQAGARMRLEILGSGPAERSIEQTALPDGRLVRLGHVPHEQALDTLERWDVGVAAFSDLEGFYFSPLKLFEYMAAGLCPVVSDVGGLGAIVEHGRAGIVVAPDDPRALAQALLTLDRNRALLRELGARARSVSGRRPSWAENAGRVIAAIEDACTASSAIGGERR
jgi:glycosyltransferase involved in cell wall biosynthesis